MGRENLLVSNWASFQWREIAEQVFTCPMISFLVNSLITLARHKHSETGCYSSLVRDYFPQLRSGLSVILEFAMSKMTSPRFKKAPFFTILKKHIGSSTLLPILPSRFSECYIKSHSVACSFIEQAISLPYLCTAASRALCGAGGIANAWEQKCFPSKTRHPAAHEHWPVEVMLSHHTEPVESWIAEGHCWRWSAGLGRPFLYV